MTDATVEVSVPQGRIRGIVEESILGVKYIAFRGIPYAKPPVNDLRFLVSRFFEDKFNFY